MKPSSIPPYDIKLSSGRRIEELWAKDIETALQLARDIYCKPGEEPIAWREATPPIVVGPIRIVE